MKKHVEISMSLSTIKDRLIKALLKGGEPHAELITNQIVDNLETTEMGLSQLLLAFMGIQEKINYIVGDEILVSPDKLSSWRFERADMETKGMLHKGHIKATITNIDMRKKKAIDIKFDGIYKSGSKLEDREITDEIYPKDIVPGQDLVLARPDLADLL